MNYTINYYIIFNIYLYPNNYVDNIVHQTGPHTVVPPLPLSIIQ